MAERLFMEMLDTMNKQSYEKPQDVFSDFIVCYSILLLIFYLVNNEILEQRHLYYFL